MPCPNCGKTTHDGCSGRGLEMRPSDRVMLQFGPDHGLLCPKCNTEMDAVGMPEHDCNGWECPKCHHRQVEMGSYKLNNRE